MKILLLCISLLFLVGCGEHETPEPYILVCNDVEIATVSKSKVERIWSTYTVVWTNVNGNTGFKVLKPGEYCYAKNITD